MNITERLRQLGIIPVVSLPKLEHALPLAESLLAGGLPCAEITFRTAAAADAIEQIAKHFPELILGAGTVLTTAQAQCALDCGAQFLVSPGTNPTTVEFSLSKGATIFPGVCTPTEVELALSKGVDVLKFFPAEPAGGVNFLKALCAPYGQVQFIPTGGIDSKNIGQYLALKQVVACGGSWMVKPELFAAGDFATVKQLAAEAVAQVAQHRLSPK
ncbi:MAG TPA: bifunctional 4-hydroxy-2-oxoglutarate aldolase/2-dehydro-3-deoxy-phosphogluconate aldolase [Blastocatellia bacterium]|nr:bifunctional 4-hydroxy-2-oxoglutarate aldolase/2-dehydro-3-deoxy-phosphogluconate aldolase [Blastocatellia bacterium]HMV86034.1 bifunctional 4-hydroxy-2-oxoglutarate aldolase/2-dehydro-3-deoxy-phosphogluconate aldolase [Blastocatellia bacterium]HMX28516.1 bifunctional 4-hydroxy-2-oxoglutarate aldolase/2-dehydro-3-deoxy-phosphogluconate aldolase [Blastocatellia bacterium]HMY73699.1 bifunctional 4-hydroxy-2-oxoglutarate aldolase/2-dehydro-3-deoxy-phosphogluconate aldolase [Blastocatellia bacter